MSSETEGGELMAIEEAIVKIERLANEAYEDHQVNGDSMSEAHYAAYNDCLAILREEQERPFTKKQIKDFLKIPTHEKRTSQALGKEDK